MVTDIITFAVHAVNHCVSFYKGEEDGRGMSKCLDIQLICFEMPNSFLTAIFGVAVKLSAQAKIQLGIIVKTPIVSEAHRNNEMVPFAVELAHILLLPDNHTLKSMLLKTSCMLLLWADMPTKMS